MKQLFRRISGAPFGQLYDEAGLKESVRKSLNFVILGNMCATLAMTITNGSALAGFAGQLGANDLVFGILSAIPFFGTLTQIPVASLVSRTGKRRLYMLTYGTIGRSLWILIGLVPFFVPMEIAWLRIWVVIMLSAISAFMNSFINVSFSPWLADLVPMSIRGRWVSRRDRIISVVGMAVGLITAYILDHVDGYLAYTIVFIIAGIIGAVDMFFFLTVDDPPTKRPPTTKLLPVMKRIFTDKPFMRYLIFWTAWSFTSNMALSYITRYALEGLHLTFMQITISSQIVGAIITVLLLPRWGSLMDNQGYKVTMRLSCLVATLSTGILLFASPGSPVTFFLYSIISASFFSAIQLISVNMTLAYSPADQRPSYVAIQSCFSSILGSFLGVLTGGALLEWMPGFFSSAGVTIGGNPPDQYKILFGISIVLRLAVIFLLLPRLEDNKDMLMRMDAEDRAAAEAQAALDRELENSELLQ